MRIHSCGKTMVESCFGNTDPTPEFRSQPIYLCSACQRWEPGEGWHGELPDGWTESGWLSNPLPEVRA